MKFFLDTANLDEIKTCASWGLLDGVTTNPTLMAREGIHDQKARIREICRICEGPVSAEVNSTAAGEMVREGTELAAIAENVAVKIPLTLEGLAATRELASRDIAVNVTLVFTPLQALLAARAGCVFVSPFVGRLDDLGYNGTEILEDIITVLSNYPYIETEVIVASVRSPQHVFQAAQAGADICTVPFKIFEQLVSHPLTDKGLAAFQADHRKAAAKDPSQH
jgi:transaldolase